MSEASQPKYRVLYQQDDKSFAIKVCATKQELDAWMIGHPGSYFIRFKVFANGSSLFFDSLEEAKGAEKKFGEPCKPIFPGQNFSQEAITLVYGLQ